MKKLVKVFGVVAMLLVVLGGILFAVGHFQTKGAGLLIESSPQSAVFINAEQVGRTPIELVLDPGEVVVRLVPDSFEKPLSPYETKITLAPEVQTVVKRDFGETEELGSGVIVSFEKTSGSEVSISAISNPDAAEVTIDGQVKGFTPYKTSSITAAPHQLIVSAPGYLENSLSVTTLEGYKLTAIFDLAPDKNAILGTEVESEEEEPVVEDPKEFVEILNTGTGFLRVRSEPTTTSEEVGRVVPEEQYEFLEEDEDTGWFKIVYDDSDLDDPDVGWVTNQFAKKVEKESSVQDSSESDDN